MKQAILITAYKDFPQLERLTSEFDERFNIYIHIDKKSSLTSIERNVFLRNGNIKYLGQDYRVNWGGLNHLRAYLQLVQVALKNLDNQYFHLITGQDFPIQSNSYFDRYLDGKQDHMSAFTMPAAGWKNGGMDRLKYYQFYDLFNARKSTLWISRFRRLQINLGFKRKIPAYLGQLYGGNTYWSLSRSTLKYVVDFTKKNPRFFNRFRHTFCAEEIYFQTIIMNSTYRENVITDDLRYMDWKSGRGGFPAFLDPTDFEEIINSNKLFVRKLDMNANSLFEMLSSHRKNNP
ncbi:beta-1,6-N-acetylglucosaminyltransferase [Nonlabens agnitus]|uniref:beta-1,6-N-acetylglucosaminyltransferase n=1 Tax=Nonlabens agnitus TaxID=870484 RepID=UPI001559AD01|nr:beta-1,6-N-acetylglucosaminyltransferase [Nonlabens agnitus]